jgi:hypothetical protein
VAYESAKKIWAFIPDSPFDAEWLDYLTEAAGAHGAELQLTADGDDAEYCVAKCGERIIRIDSEGGAPGGQYDRFMRTIETILPNDLVFRGLVIRNAPDVPGYALLSRDEWARLEAEAPTICAVIFRPLAAGAVAPVSTRSPD